MRSFFFIFLSGFLFVACGNPDRAAGKKKTLDQLLVAHPDSLPLLIEKGNNLMDSLAFDKALNYGAKAFRLDSKNT